MKVLSRSLHTNRLNQFKRSRLNGNGTKVESFGYDAAETSTARRNRTASLLSEDKTLLPHQRRKLISDTRDLRRNFAIAMWAVEKHLDSVATFTFQSHTGDKALDKDIEALMWDWGQTCDVAGRHPIDRFIRLAEAMRMVDGDMLVVKQEDGQIQGIEGDRIKNPDKDDAVNTTNGWTHGVKTDRAGKALAYAICKRDNGAFVLDQIVRAEFAFHHGYFSRFDQVRGISPLASSINPFTDLYEALEYTRRKIKVAQLFGLIIKRNGGDPLGVVTEGEEDANGKVKYEVDFGAGPIKLELDIDEDASFLENKTPSTEFQAFSESEIRLGLAPLGIPYTMYNVRGSTYSGGRQDLIQYEQSCKPKRAGNIWLLSDLTYWRQALWVIDGTLTLPRGFDPRKLEHEWVPGGTPWIDPLNEAQADIIAIRNNLDSYQRVVKRKSGGEFDDVVEENSEAMKTVKAAGLPWEPDITPSPAAPTPAQTQTGDGNA